LSRRREKREKRAKKKKEKRIRKDFENKDKEGKNLLIYTNFIT